MPIASLPDRLEALHRAVPPDRPQPLLPAPADDHRSKTSRNLSQEHSIVRIHCWHLRYVDVFFIGLPNKEFLYVNCPIAHKCFLFCTYFLGAGGVVIVMVGSIVSFRNISSISRSSFCPLTPRWEGTYVIFYKDPVWHRFSEFFAAGLVAGTLAGPPCETWSAAQHLPPPHHLHPSSSKWPRPLRSAQRPWGIPLLRLRELAQLHTRSALILSNVKIELAVVLHGGAAIQEHPAPHEDTCYASVWHTELQNLFRAGAPGYHATADHSPMEIWCYDIAHHRPSTFCTCTTWTSIG